MDEIFDRIKSIKIKRRILVISLILSELLGILVLVWFLRIPLSQKFLSSNPKAYSITQMNPKTRYLIAQGDFLSGQSKISQIVVLVRNGGQILDKHKIKPNTEGSWYYQFPPGLNPGIKTVTVGELDEKNKVQKTYDLKVRIISNNLLAQNKLEKTFSPFFNKVSAPAPFNNTQTPTVNTIFYADFEYDAKNKSLTQISEGSKSGSLAASFKNQPASKSGILNYKMEVLDKNSRILQSGWGNMNQIAKDKYTLRVETSYIKDVLINLYLKNNILIWRRDLNQ